MVKPTRLDCQYLLSSPKLYLNALRRPKDFSRYDKPLSGRLYSSSPLNLIWFIAFDDTVLDKKHARPSIQWQRPAASE